MDPGYPADLSLLNAIVRHREIVGTFVSDEMRRGVYERISKILPNNPYVYQHRSILERELKRPDLAIDFARKAVALDARNVAFANTLGLALELAARTEKETRKWQALLGEAEKIFDEALRRYPGDPYGYLGQLHILRQRIEHETNAEKQAVLRAKLLSLLEEAYEATEESPMIAGELAKHREEIGDLSAALKLVNEGISKMPADTRLRELLVRLYMEAKDLPAALKAALEGVKLDPNSWRLQRLVARIRRQSDHSVDTVRGHYDSAIRHNQRDTSLKVELASYLFMKGLYADAKVIFLSLKNKAMPPNERNRIQEVWKDATGPLRFRGKIARIVGAGGYVTVIPQNFDVFFWRTRPPLDRLREGDNVELNVMFNSLGPLARIV